MFRASKSWSSSCPLVTYPRFTHAVCTSVAVGFTAAWETRPLASSQLAKTSPREGWIQVMTLWKCGVWITLKKMASCWGWPVSTQHSWKKISDDLIPAVWVGRVKHVSPNIDQFDPFLGCKAFCLPRSNLPDRFEDCKHHLDFTKTPEAVGGE